jgi:hypothetical protein
MTQTAGDRRRRLFLAAVAGVTPAVLLLGGIEVAAAAATTPALSIVAAARSVTAERYADGGRGFVDLDLGVNIVAGDTPLEIHATRKSYADPIVADQIVTHDGGEERRRLPAGTVTDFSGLKRFTTITIKNSKGKAVKKYETDFCANAWDSTRTRPDAPAQNPYPRGCSTGNPFILGAVWGIQAGWNAQTADMPMRGNLDLPLGKYTVSVTLNPAYQKFFQIPAKAATATVQLTVVKASAAGDLARAAKARASSGHGAHHGEGDPKAQISSYLPEFRPAARRPAANAMPRGGPRPDLRSLPAWGISLQRGTNAKTGKPNGKWYVNFGATVWNAGTSPLLVDGFRRSGANVMDAYQYFFDAGGNQVGSRQAGTMEWDARTGHKHWHFKDFAQYNLLRANLQQSVRSGKESFCLANTDAVDYTVPSAKWRPENTDLATSCGMQTSLGVREVLDVGSGDTYSQDRPGQSFEITGLPNGTYYIQVKANPGGKLAESSTGNNTSLRKIVLGGTAKKRTLTVPAVNGIRG